MKNKQLNTIRRLYQDGVNLMHHFRQSQDESLNDTNSILISYDFQAGTYIAYAEDRPEFTANYTQSIANILAELGAESVMEVGVGEATTLFNVAQKMPKKIPYYGFDLSWSRVKYAQRYCERDSSISCELFVGDLFHIPVLDNAVDVVYTSHSLEPNGGREKEALEELYRISAKYLVLLEPCYELADNSQRERMVRHGYITNLQTTIAELGYRVIEFRLFDYSANPLNPTGLTIIEKNSQARGLPTVLACPITKGALEKHDTAFYCPSSLLAYPSIMGVPCLLPDNAVVASHFLDFKH